MSNARTESARSPIGIGLWIVQGLLALTFVGTGIWKLTTLISELATKMPWMGQVGSSPLCDGRPAKQNSVGVP